MPAKTLPDVALPARPSVYLINRPGSEQSVIIAGHLIGKRSQDDDIAVEALNDILGGAFTSRVNMNLREDKGWSYGADTTVVQTQAQRPFLAIAPVQADQTAASMSEIKREIEEFISTHAATDAEVATSKKRSTLTLPGRWETARAVARDIAELVRFGLPDDYWSNYAGLVGRLDVAVGQRGGSAAVEAGTNDVARRRRSQRHRGRRARARLRRRPHHRRGRQPGRTSMNVL